MHDKQRQIMVVDLADLLNRGLEFDEIRDVVYKALDLEEKFEIWLKNFPYCIINEYSRDHILPRQFLKKNGDKIKLCQKCKLNNLCPGFPRGYLNKFRQQEFQPIGDLPAEIMIELTTRCNLNCDFCFNSKREQDFSEREMTTMQVKKIIQSIKNSGIKIIRFTGGEPLLRSDLVKLAGYAKQRGLEVRLNTNGILVNSDFVKSISGKIDNVLVSVNSFSETSEKDVTGYLGSLNKKVRAINLFSLAGIPKIRIGTIAFKKNIENFDKLAKLVLNLPIDEWEFYRPITVKDSVGSLLKSDIDSLVEKISKWKKKTNKNIIIANAVPFCSSSDPYQANLVSCGALFDDGHNRLVVDSQGYVKPHYFLNKNIGSPLEIDIAWNHHFVKKIRSLDYLPKKCKQCRFLYKCRGGSRHFAKKANGSWFATDPLMPAPL